MRICLALCITHLLSTLPRLVSFSAIVPSAGQVATFIRTVARGTISTITTTVPLLKQASYTPPLSPSLPSWLLRHSLRYRRRCFHYLSHMPPALRIVRASASLCATSLLASTVSAITRFALNVTTLLEGGETRG
jgi:hypothetical protein